MVLPALKGDKKKDKDDIIIATVTFILYLKQIKLYDHKLLILINTYYIT